MRGALWKLALRSSSRCHPDGRREALGTNLVFALDRRGCGLARRLRAVQKRLDVVGEQLEIIELVLQHLLHHGKVDLQLAMNQDVAETRDGPEASSEFRGNRSQLRKSVDCARVIG